MISCWSRILDRLVLGHWMTPCMNMGKRMEGLVGMVLFQDVCPAWDGNWSEPGRHRRATPLGSWALADAMQFFQWCVLKWVGNLKDLEIIWSMDWVDVVTKEMHLLAGKTWFTYFCAIMYGCLPDAAQQVSGVPALAKGSGTPCLPGGFCSNRARLTDF